MEMIQLRHPEAERVGGEPKCTREAAEILMARIRSGASEQELFELLREWRRAIELDVIKVRRCLL